MADVSKFFDWINERHRIYLKKQCEGPPWTDDWIMQTYKFCNVFRQLDRGTIALNDLLRRSILTNPQIAFTTIWYRLFNLDVHANHFRVAPGMEELMVYLKKRRADGEQIFTGAHMTTGVAGEHKLTTFERSVHAGFELAPKISHLCRSGYMAIVYEALKALPMVGGFIAYEMVCDLRFSLIEPKDSMTFTNIGPGAKRGLERLGLWKCPRDGLLQMVKLLKMAPDYLERHVVGLFELREIEHCLCEFDKYERTRLGEGRPRSKYHGGADTDTE